MPLPRLRDRADVDIMRRLLTRYFIGGNLSPRSDANSLDGRLGRVLGASCNVNPASPCARIRKREPAVLHTSCRTQLTVASARTQASLFGR